MGIKIENVVRVLEFIDNEPKKWEKIEEYCKKNNIDSNFAWQVLNDRENALFDYEGAKNKQGKVTFIFKTNSVGHKIIIDFRKGNLQKTAFSPLQYVFLDSQ